MGIRNFNSDNLYIYYCRQESLRIHGVALRVNRSLKCKMWVQPQKWQDDLSSFPRQIIQHQSSPRLYLNPFAKDAEVDSLWRLEHRLELTSQKVVLFIIWDWNAIWWNLGNRKSRDSWNNRQGWPWSTEWSRAKGNRILSRQHIGHSKKCSFPTQETALHMDITRWSTVKSDWLFSFCQRWKSSI